MRNKYLNMQREKMRQLKQHLNRAKFSQKNTEQPEIKKDTPENKTLEFVPGVIVKMSLEEPCSEVKKTKVRSHRNLNPVLTHILFVLERHKSTFR